VSRSGASLPASMPRTLAVRLALGTLAACTSVAPQLASDQIDTLLTVPAPVRLSVRDYPANLVESVLAFYGITLDREAAPQVEVASEIAADGLQDVFSAHGLAAFVFHGTLDNEATGILRHLDGGRPVLTMVEDDRGHRRWLLLVGHDHGARILIAQDPLARLLALPKDSFAREWGRTESLTLLATLQ